MECFQNVNLENWMLTFVSSISGNRKNNFFRNTYSKPKQKIFIFHFENNE